MPGIGEEIDGAVQQAPQAGRQAGAVSGVFIGNRSGAAGTLLPGSILLGAPSIGASAGSHILSAQERRGRCCIAIMIFYRGTVINFYVPVR
jgi:predicted aconitase with swiveling domain